MRNVFLLLTLLAALACSPRGLRDGDLLFLSGDPGDFAAAVDASTGARGFSHVGILDGAGPGRHVLEATPENGVVRTPLRVFLASAAACSAFRYPDAAAARRAVATARTFIGRPYDFAFLPGTDALYCSELVYESFRAEDGRPLFHAVPMSFSDTTGRLLPFWISYYDSLGVAIPEGQPGTNPNDLSRDPVLIPIR